jgi:cobalt/nickel transport system permease protein
VIGRELFTELDSVVHRLDPRSKLVGFLLPILIVASTPRDQIWPHSLYLSLVVALAIASRVPAAHIVRSCAATSPIILLAALLLFAGGGYEAAKHAASMALKAYGCVALMSLLTATSKVHELLWAMRRLGAPEVLSLVASLMFRYAFLIKDEYHRMARARLSRTCRPIQSGRYALYAHQFALLFIRSWERAERIHAAMVARGFTGALALGQERNLHVTDLLFPAASCALFLIGRFSGLAVSRL